MRKTLLRRFVLTIAALSLLPAASASAAWTHPFDVPASSLQAGAEVVTAPDGTATATWVRYAPGGEVVEAATKPPGGIFGPAVTLAAEPIAVQLRAAVDAEGTVTIAWAARSDDATVVRSVSRPAGGQFSPARDVSDSGSDAQDVQLAAAGSRAVLTWQQAGRIRAASASHGERFEVEKPLTPVGETGSFPQVAIAPTGAAVIAWVREIGGTSYRVRAAARQADEPFAALADVRGSTSRLEAIKVAMSPTGRATLAWRRSVTGVGSLVESASRGVVGNFGPISFVDGAIKRPANDYALAVSPDDTALIVVPDGTVRAAIRPSGSAFGGMKPIPGAAGRLVRARFVDGERAVVSFRATDGASATVLEPDGQFGPVQVIGPAADTGLHGLGNDDQGTATAFWLRNIGTSEDDGPWRIEMAALDGVAPDFASVSVPATGMTGHPIPMSAPARDRWSGATVTWKFGDGGTEEGEALEYVYSKPGVYTVEITATDGAGNATTTTRTTTVRGRSAGF